MIYEFADDMNTLYRYVMARILHEPEYRPAPRGKNTREVINANLTLRNPRARIITSPTRKVNYKFAVGEFIWYMTGRNDLSFIERYNQRLSAFSDDGTTLNSAYGRRIFGNRGWSADNNVYQWGNTRELLKRDPDTRQAVIHILGAFDHFDETKDVPCTCTLQFFIRDGRLIMHAHMRSNDVFWGLPYDVFSFTLLQELMALELGLELGEYHHTAGSMHIYENHFGTAEEIVAEPFNIKGSEPMPALESPESLWRACQAEPYISTRQPIPVLLRHSGVSGETWMVDQLLSKWGPAFEEGE